MKSSDPLPKFLIIHDHSDTSTAIAKLFRNFATCIVAPTLQNARQQLALNQDIIAVLFDGQMQDVPGGDSTIGPTLILVRELRQSDRGISMFAYSGLHNEALVAAGCHVAVKMDNMVEQIMPYLLSDNRVDHH